MNRAVSVVLGILLAAALITVTAAIAGVLAMYGANVAGLSEAPSYNLLPLVYLFYGGLAGAVLLLPVAAGCYFVIGKKCGAHPNFSLLTAALILWAVAFPMGFAFYKGGLFLQEREREKWRLSSEREKEEFLRAQNK